MVIGRFASAFDVLVSLRSDLVVIGRFESVFDMLVSRFTIFTSCSLPSEGHPSRQISLQLTSSYSSSSSFSLRIHLPFHPQRFHPVFIVRCGDLLRCLAVSLFRSPISIMALQGLPVEVSFRLIFYLLFLDLIT